MSPVSSRQVFVQHRNVYLTIDIIPYCLVITLSFISKAGFKSVLSIKVMNTCGMFSVDHS